MKRILLLAAAALLSNTLASAAHQLQGGSVFLQTSATQFSTTLGNVQKITFRTQPGGSGKVWIGCSTLSVSTNACAFKILYPNTSGGIGDEYTIEDRSGADGIDTSTLYIAGGVYGELISWESYSTGVSASTFLTPYKSGPYIAVSNHFDSSTTMFAALIQVAIVPGQTGKIAYGGSSTYNDCTGTFAWHHNFKVLWPNASGTALTDFTQTSSPDGSNNIQLSALSSCSAVSGEAPLITMWRRI